MQKAAILVAAILLATGVSATAASQGSGSGVEAEDDQAKEEKKICRTERATGSLTRQTRICMTAAQWRELNARTRKGLDEMGQNATGGTAVANNPGLNGPGGGL